MMGDFFGNQGPKPAALPIVVASPAMLPIVVAVATPAVATPCAAMPARRQRDLQKKRPHRPTSALVEALMAAVVSLPWLVCNPGIA